MQLAIRTSAAFVRQIAPNFQFRVLRDARTNQILDGRRVDESVPGVQIKTETVDTDEPDLFRVIYNLMSRPQTHDERAMLVVSTFGDLVTEHTRRNREAQEVLPLNLAAIGGNLEAAANEPGGPEQPGMKIGGDSRDILRMLAGGIPRHFIDNALFLWGTPHGDVVQAVLAGKIPLADARLKVHARTVLAGAEPIFENLEIPRIYREALFQIAKPRAQAAVAEALAPGANMDAVIRESVKGFLDKKSGKGAVDESDPDVRLTPSELVEAIRYMFGGEIAFDPATTWSNPTEATAWAALDDPDNPQDGSTMRWPDRTFVNPPYSHRSDKTKPGGVDEFVRQAIAMRDHPDQPRIVMLVPANTDADIYQGLLSECQEALFFDGRFTFDRVEDKKRVTETKSANNSYMLVGFGPVWLKHLVDLGFPGVVMKPFPRPMSPMDLQSYEAEQEALAEHRLNYEELDLDTIDHAEVRAMIERTETEQAEALAEGRRKVAAAKAASDQKKADARRASRKARNTP